METPMNGFIFAVCAMILFGVAPLFSKLGLSNLDPLVALTLRSGIITVLLVVFLAASGKVTALTVAAPRDIMFIGLDGICGALVGQLAYYYALKTGELGKVAPTVAAFPLVALVLGLLVLGEKLTWGKALGATLVVAGVALIHYR